MSVEEEGVFQLKTRKDVLAKLKWELAQLKVSPHNPYVAVNFFITADSLVDWTYPGKPNDAVAKRHRKGLRDSSLLLQVVFHLAAKAKHFKNLGEYHRSVNETKLVGGAFQWNFVQANAFQVGRLKVKFFPLAAAQLGKGDEMLAVDLAQDVYDDWEKRCS